MYCKHCGTEINTRILEPDGTVVCPGCGTRYRRKTAPKPERRPAAAPAAPAAERPAPRKAAKRSGTGAQVAAIFFAIAMLIVGLWAGKQLINGLAATKNPQEDLVSAADDLMIGTEGQNKEGKEASAQPIQAEQQMLGLVYTNQIKPQEAFIIDLCAQCGLDYYDYASCQLDYAEDGAPGIYDSACTLIDSGCTTIIIYDDSGSRYSTDAAERITQKWPEIRVVAAAAERFPESSDSGSKPKTAEIEWTTIVYTQTDTDGYTYEITIKLSPWILLSNTELVNSVWNEIGANNPLPGFNDWGLQESGNAFYRQVPKGGTSFPFVHHMNDMYYCLGTVEIRNRTEGWSITSGNSRTLYPCLDWYSAFNDEVSMGYVISRVYFSNGAKDQSDRLWFSAVLTKDHWGPVAFVIMAPESFSPAFPDGEHGQHMLDGYFYRDGEWHLDVIGKDGIYLES